MSEELAALRKDVEISKAEIALMTRLRRELKACRRKQGVAYRRGDEVALLRCGRVLHDLEDQGRVGLVALEAKRTR